MLDNTITLAVDEENDDSTTNHVYSRYEEYQNRSLYIGASHALDDRDMIGFYRTNPKASGNFKGVAKSAVKLTKDITVDGVDGVASLTSPIIIEIGFSVPVGATSAERILARQTMLAALDDDTLMEKLNAQLMV
jgi:hypothetical protein